MMTFKQMPVQDNNHVIKLTITFYYKDSVERF